MNYYRIGMTCESQLTFDEVAGDVVDDVLDYIENRIKGYVGVASWDQINEQGDTIKSDYDIFEPKEAYSSMLKSEREAKQGWTRCADAEPKKDGEYLVFDAEEGYFVDTYYTHDGLEEYGFKTYKGWQSSLRTVAWMPFPKYRGR